jgi:hypothetical protein
VKAFDILINPNVARLPLNELNYDQMLTKKRSGAGILGIWGPALFLLGSAYERQERIKP